VVTLEVMVGAISGSGDEAHGKQEIQTTVPTLPSHKFRMFGQILQPAKYCPLSKACRRKHRCRRTRRNF